ncbi:hypothetical protein ACVXZ4_09780 [Lacisediminihabitans sp. FW035]
MFDELSQVLQTDADDDVTAIGDSLLVRGRLFAFRADRLLVVDLPPERARDLIERGMAVNAAGNSPAHGTWVSISDIEDWPEIASEAHQFVGEPAVGGES